MERDDTDDSRFTIERLDLVPRSRLDGNKRRLVLKVMDAVFSTIDQRLQDLRQLIDKNQRDLRKCTSRTTRYKEILETYGAATRNEDLTSVVKYYFALARSDKLFLAQPYHYSQTNIPSMRPYEDFQTNESKEDRRQLEDNVAWLTSYRTVKNHNQNSQDKNHFQLYGLQKINRLELESRAGQENLEILRRKRVRND
jgi:hypothetical protein